MLDRAPGVFRVLAVAEFGDAPAKASSVQPDLIVVVARSDDIPFALLEELREICPHTSIFLLMEGAGAGLTRDGMVRKLLRAGVDGWIDSIIPPGYLPRILELVSRGNVAVWPRRSLAHLRSAITGVHAFLPQPGKSLTTRELEVLELLLQKLSNKEIAKQLFISESTVKTHVRNILQKLGARSRAVLISNASTVTSLLPRFPANRS